MPSTDLTTLLTDLGGRDRLTAEDALDVRRVVFGEVAVTPDEAEALVALNEATDRAEPEWRQMFVEAMTDYVVRQQEPQGYVDQAKADWLIGALGRDGRVWRDSELEALVHILERAESAPASLSAFALDQVKAGILGSGKGVEHADVELLRRIVFAAGGEGSLAITRDEAEVLFDINDAVRGKDNDPAWTDFYAKAIGNAVMAASGYLPPSREEALRAEQWLEDREPTVRFLGRAASSLFNSPSKVIEAYRHPDPLSDLYAADNARQDAARAAAAPVTDDEASWIAERIGRDGELDENEKALVRFIAAESPNLHPSLQDLVDRAA
jgi:hypothetical protein